jgi:LysM repeat protein
LASLVALAATALSTGCGGSGDGGAPDLSRIATATLPNPLPEPFIVDEVRSPSQGESYTVQAGDTLSSIADQLGSTVDEIIEANDIDDPRQLFVGQVLIIPGGAAPTEELVLSATAEPAATPQVSEERTYTVQSGDNAYEIALSFGITIEELVAANNTTIDDLRSLQVGDVLSIPAPAAAATPEPAP